MVIDVRVSPSALILGGDFFTGAILATDTTSNILRAEACLSFCCVLAS